MNTFCMKLDNLFKFNYSDLKPDEKYIYDTSELNEDNMWLKDILLSDR